MIQRSKMRGQLFEDPQFVPSNRLLVDDNNQYIISYLGRTRFDGSSIEWLRPHEICQRMGLREGPEMFVGQSDRFDINQGEIGNCWFLAAVANLVENENVFIELSHKIKDLVKTTLEYFVSGFGGLENGSK